MARRVGRALEKALASEQGEARPEVRESLLMHPQRRELFRLLCARPCATVGELAREAGLSSNAVRWHLERLAAANLIVRGPPATYYAVGFIDPKDGPLFRVLAEAGARHAFRAILEAPGTTQHELCAALGVSRQSVFKSTSVLERHGLATSIRDGRFRRYYPTELLAVRREAHRVRAKAFSDALVKRLEANGLTPKVLRSTDRELLVRIARGKSAEVLDLPLDPFTTALE